MIDTSKIIDADELAYEFVRIGKRLAAQSKDSRLVTLQTFAQAMAELFEEIEIEVAQLMKEETDA